MKEVITIQKVGNGFIVIDCDGQNVFQDINDLFRHIAKEFEIDWLHPISKAFVDTFIYSDNENDKIVAPVTESKDTRVMSGKWDVINQDPPGGYNREKAFDMVRGKHSKRDDAKPQHLPPEQDTRRATEVNEENWKAFCEDLRKGKSPADAFVDAARTVSAENFVLHDEMTDKEVDELIDEVSNNLGSNDKTDHFHVEDDGRIIPILSNKIEE